MKNFFEQIVYSAANEDPMSEIQGLQLSDDDRVLCITGSGARALDLLCAADCDVFAVDYNPRQNHLLELKMAAIACLDYEALLALLGIDESSHRMDLFHQISHKLSPQAKAFWQAHPKLIDAGVIYQGAWEKYMRHIARLFWLQKSTVLELFSNHDLATQQSLWNERWKSKLWSINLGCACQKAFACGLSLWLI